MTRLLSLLTLAFAATACAADLPTLWPHSGTEQRWSNNNWDGKGGMWDTAAGFGGPNAVLKNNGVVVEGSSNQYSDSIIKQVQGPGFVTEGIAHLVRDVRVLRSFRGFDLRGGDCKYSGLYTDGTTEFGIRNSGSGSTIHNSHPCGSSTVGFDLAATTFLTGINYADACPIGAWIRPAAYSTTIDNLYIGPGTCWERGLKIDANGCSVRIGGEVPLDRKDSTSAGIEVGPGVVHTTIDGQLVIQWDKARPDAKATGLILRGQRSKVDLKGGWNAPTGATFIRVAEDIAGSTIEIRGSGDGGCVLDASGTSWRDVRVRISWSGTAERFKPPKSAVNCVVEVDGKLQRNAK